MPAHDATDPSVELFGRIHVREWRRWHGQAEFCADGFPAIARAPNDEPVFGGCCVNVGIESVVRGDCGVFVVDVGCESLHHRVHHCDHGWRRRDFALREDRRTCAFPPGFGVALRMQDDGVGKYSSDFFPKRGGWPIDRGPESLEERVPIDVFATSSGGP